MSNIYKFGAAERREPNRKEKRAQLSEAPRWVRKAVHKAKPVNRLKHPNPLPKSDAEQEMEDYYKVRNSLKRERRSQ